MHALTDAFTALGPQPIGTAVLVGADAATLEAATSLPCERLVLVQGAPRQPTSCVRPSRAPPAASR